MTLHPAELAAENSAMAQVLVGSQGNVLWHNPSYVELFGEPETIPSELKQLIHCSKYRQNGTVNTVLDSALVVNVRRIEQSDCQIANIGEVVHYLEVVSPQFIASRTLSESLRRGIIDIDPLTGVLGRAGIEREIARWLACCEQRPFVLLFLDLDGFKQINDKHGHLAGDECLRQVSSHIVTTLRTGDVIGRFGGDEFVLLVAGLSCDHEVDPIANRIEQAIKKTNQPASSEQSVGASIGWAFSRPDITPLELLKEADLAMYAKKRNSIQESH